MWLFYEVKIYTQTSRVSYRKVVKMEKQEVLALMLDSINEDNRAICTQGGMAEAEIEAQIQQSQPALALILGNMYDKLKNANVIA
jgi:hypothetical protein